MKHIGLIILIVLFPIFGTARNGKVLNAFGLTVPVYDIHGIDVSRYQERINWKEISGF
jgi:GH25 family lysozyme M1 (1,4-beta-N-acetylmuramidase)